jgi:predicted GNAT family N-acyltransferase
VRPTAEVRRARDEQELAAALALREQVFCGEQGVPLAADLDGLDDDAVQLVAVDDDDGTVLGTCRVLIEPGGTARFGRLCVSAAARGHGVGGALLAAAERESRAGGARRIGMHAQTRALELYRRAGYTPYGDPFDEEGIEHVGMEKRLT